MKSCGNCGADFVPKRCDAVVCSPACGKQLHNSAYSKHKQHLGLCAYRCCTSAASLEGIYCSTHAAKNNERRKKYTLSYKLRVLDAYGGRVCVGCGEDEVVVLSIDHVHGGGNKHRQSINTPSGTAFYQWLIRNNFPPGFRVLCMNCQFRSRAGVTLPSQRFKEKNENK